MRTAILSALVLLVATFPAAAQDKAKPNTVAPKEIADGWILLFDGETTFGWTAKGANRGGTLKAADGALDLDALGEGHIRTTTAFEHAELRFEYHCDGP